MLRRDVVVETHAMRRRAEGGDVGDVSSVRSPREIGFVRAPGCPLLEHNEDIWVVLALEHGDFLAALSRSGVYEELPEACLDLFDELRLNVKFEYNLDTHFGFLSGD